METLSQRHKEGKDVCAGRNYTVKEETNEIGPKATLLNNVNVEMYIHESKTESGTGGEGGKRRMGSGKFYFT